MIDFTFFGYGAGVPLVGFLCGAAISVVLRALTLARGV